MTLEGLTESSMSDKNSLDDLSEMFKAVSEEDGSVRIADEVLAVIAGVATAEIEGVEGMMGSFVENLSERLGRPELRRGVKVQTDEQGVLVDLFITVEYGRNIPKVARSIQENVKGAIENMTDLAVAEVNVHVQEVAFPGEELDETITPSDVSGGGD